MQELDGASPPNVTANILTGLGIDEYFSRTDSAGPATLLADALGSTLGLTDASGNLNTTYTYEPFGNVTISGAANSNSFQFTGRENDGTGLYYYRARYYNPTTQRFVSEDPLEFGGGDVNLYSYVDNQPTALRDPTGTQAAEVCNDVPQLCDPEWWWGLATAGAGVAVAGVGAAAGAIGDALRRQCHKCKPCVPPVGTEGYARFDATGKSHGPISTPHYHIVRVNQTPWPECKCYWNNAGVSQTPPPYGYVPPGSSPGGGGPE